MRELTAQDYLYLGKLKHLKSIKQRQDDEDYQIDSQEDLWKFLEVKQCL